MKKLVIIFICLICMGCYNYHELNSISIISAILFDYHDGNYEVTIEISGDEEKEIVKGQGKSISEALENANIMSKKNLSFYHIKMVFVTKDVDLRQILLFLIRDPRKNSSFYLAYTEEKDILTASEEKEIGKDINDLLKKEFKETFFDISNNIFDEHIDFYLPIIDGDMSLKGIMLYDGLKIKKSLDIRDIDILHVLNNKNDAYFKIDEGNGFFEVNVNEVKTSIDIKDKVNINVKLKLSIVEYDTDIKNNTLKGLEELESRIDQEMEKLIKEFIAKLKENDSDILGIDRYINNKKHQLNKTWKDYEYEINVSSKINKKGLILE